MRFSIVRIFPVFCAALLAGCQDNRYESGAYLLKLRELEAKIETAHSAADSPRLAEALKRIERLENEMKTLCKGASNPAIEPSAESPFDSAIDGEAIAVIESVGGLIVKDETTGAAIEVDLADAAIDADCLDALPKLTRLKLLSAVGESVTPAVFETISHLTSLEELSLEKTIITIEVLQQLSGLPNLKSLQLFRSSISDDGMAVLSKYPNLQQIRVGQTKVGDEGLAHLQSMTNLAVLDLTDCNRVTNGGLAFLAR